MWPCSLLDAQLAGGVSGRRPGPDRLADLPLVPERIDDPAQTPAVLIANGGLLRGAGVDRPPHHGVGVIGHQQGPARRATYRARAESSAVRPGRCHPERRLADGKLRDDVIALPGLVKDACPERVRVESDGLASTLDPQLRLDTRHPPTVAAQGGQRRADTAACRIVRSAAGRIIAPGPAGSLTAYGAGSAAGEPDLLGRPASGPLVRKLGKVVVGGAWRYLNFDQVLHHQAAPAHEPDPFPVWQREQPVLAA